MPGWMIVLVIEVIQQPFVFLDLILGALGIGLELQVVVEEFVIKQVIVLGLVQVVFVVHGSSRECGTPV
nr:hypothetical protein L321_02717 [Pseudomonas plecoglossicida NB2011]